MKKKVIEEETMKEQQYVIKAIPTFNIKDIFECGQCFRWNKHTENSYIGIFANNVLEVIQQKDTITFQGICEGDIQDIVTKYFDLERDYETIQEKLSTIDDNMKKSIAYGRGIRILNQDLWETIISFIISANNNIPRIKGIIERLAKQYGKPILYKNNIYYTFPTPEELQHCTVEDFRKLGLGFRDIRLYETTQAVIHKKVDLDQVKQETDYTKIRETLLTLSGVGPKVADCILLFSTLKRLEAFPIDVWVRRVMNELYIHEKEENQVKQKQIEKVAHEKFGNFAGLAQQYLFYWKRETS